MTLTDFLLARIAEDEAVARAATGGSWSWDHEDWSDRDMSGFKNGCVDGQDWGHHGPDLMSSEPDPEYGGQSIVISSSGYDADQVIVAEADGRHIARHDPARVLAECEAKRRIVELHELWPVLVERQPTFEPIAGDLQSLTFRASQQIAWLTEQEYRSKFGDEPPTAPMLAALATVYADHPDYDESWRP